MLGWLKSWFFWRRSGVVSAPPGNSIECVTLTAGVARTLLEDYAAHRRSIRGDEEIGWILLGHREGSRIIALAALPAGAHRDASAAHVQFDSQVQALASRIVRQQDRRLQVVGVVHTHPGSLRTPSDGDLHGDRQWVARLRGGVAVFGIGTADGLKQPAAGAHMQIEGELCFSWYSLAAGESRYHPLPVTVTPGTDLAKPARAVWQTIESFAESVEHLCRQFANVRLDVIREDCGDVLAAKIALGTPGEQLRLLLHGEQVRYYWERAHEVIAVDPQEPNLVRAVHLILAELAREATPRELLIEN